MQTIRTLATYGLLLMAHSALALEVMLIPSVPVISIADSVSIDVQVSGPELFGKGNSLSSYDLTVLFDPTRFEIGAVEFGDPAFGNQLDAFGLGTLSSQTFGAGAVQLTEVSLDDSASLNDFQADSFRLARFFFKPSAPGEAQFTLSAVTLGDQDGRALSASLGDTSVRVVAPIPEPAAGALVAGGALLLYLFGAGRRKGSRALPDRQLGNIVGRQGRATSPRPAAINTSHAWLLTCRG